MCLWCKMWKGAFKLLTFSVFSLKLLTNLKYRSWTQRTHQKFYTLYVVMHCNTEGNKVVQHTLIVDAIITKFANNHSPVTVDQWCYGTSVGSHRDFHLTSYVQRLRQFALYLKFIIKVIFMRHNISDYGRSCFTIHWNSLYIKHKLTNKDTQHIHFCSVLYSLRI